MPVRVLVVFAALAVTALWVAPAGAAPKQGKEYQVDVEPVESAGVTDDDYTVTLTNRTGTQQVGSADITVPSTMTIVNRNGWGGSGNKLELRNLGLPPNESLTIVIGLRMPCVEDTYSWIVEAKQSNDFSGTPGNALGPLTGMRDTTVQGTCKLRFVDPDPPAGVGGQPASAEKNTQIRADGFVPTSAQLVTVEAIDGSPSPERLDWFTSTIDLRLVQSGPGTLTPNPASRAATAGLARFDNLSIDRSGNYNLRATTAAAGFVGGDSADFQIIDDVGSCSSSSCRAEVNGSQSTSALTGSSIAGSGFALLSLNLGTRPVCAGYTPPTSDYYEFALAAATGDKTVLATFSKAAMKSFSGGLSALQICFAAPLSFTAQSGSPAPFDYDGEPGAEGFVGLLPLCSAPRTGPCLLDRRPMGGGGAQVRFFVPAAWGNDPRYN